MERKINVTLVILLATTTITKSFTKYLNNIPGKKKNQGTTENNLMSTTHTSGSRPASVKYKIFSLENNVTCTINCNYKIAAALDNIETLFVSSV